jgi:hypothetical protein
MQVAAFGRQDVDTIINPNLTFFKTVYKRHTPFALEPKTVQFNNVLDWNTTATATLNQIGDGAVKLYLHCDVGELNGGAGGCRFSDDVGRAMIDEVQVQIGGTRYDSLWPELMHGWEELTTDEERQLGRLTGKSEVVADLVAWAQSHQTLYTELPFWFHMDYGAMLPLVALHLTDVKIQVKLKPKASVVVGVGAPYVPVAADATLSCDLLVETVILDDNERDFLASAGEDADHPPLKYLFHQHQFLGKQTIASGRTQYEQRVVFNHPVKELIWMLRGAANETALNWFDFSGEETGQYSGESFRTCRLTLNGQERFQALDPLYFRYIQPKQHHTRIPRKHIYVYSFALYPEDGNPTGSLNFSRIDNANIYYTFSGALAEDHYLYIFARNINSATVQRGIMLLSFAS